MNKAEAFKKIDSMESELKALRAIVDAPDAPDTPKTRQFTPKFCCDYWTIMDEAPLSRNNGAIGAAALKEKLDYGIVFETKTEAEQHIAETKKRVQILNRIFELNEGWVRTSQDIGHYPMVRYSSDMGTYQIHEFEFKMAHTSQMSSISPNKYLKTKDLLMKLATEFTASELALVYM